MEEDLVVGTVALMPLEPFESLELFGDFSDLELVFMRRNSLKKGIGVCRCVVYNVKRTCVPVHLQTTRAFMEKGVEWDW